MIRSIGVTLALSGVGLLAVAACGRDAREPEMMPAAQVAPATSPRDAVEAIAAARCDNEQRCNNIGPNAKYQNREHCLSVARSDASEELSGDDCRYGVKASDLNECLGHLREASCGTVGSAFDSLGSMLSCQSRELCMD